MPGIGLGRAYGKGLNTAGWLAYSERSTPYYGCAYENGIPVMTYAVSSHCTCHLPEVWMTHLTSRTRQHLLLKMSTDIPQPITTKLCGIQSRDQDHQPWQLVHQYLPVYQCKKVTGQFLPLHILARLFEEHSFQTFVKSSATFTCQLVMPLR